jgi:hypothetical protein
MAWPEHFPKECPPNDGANAAGRFYRLVDGNPPVPTDFVSHFVKFPGKEWGDGRCQACGLSVYKDVADLQRMQKRVKGMRKMLIAAGALTFGTIKFTDTKPGGSHHTWWVPVGNNPAPLFKVI